jgi:hypothetical protein
MMLGCVLVTTGTACVVEGSDGATCPRASHDTAQGCPAGTWCYCVPDDPPESDCPCAPSCPRPGTAGPSCPSGSECLCRSDGTVDLGCYCFRGP